MRFFAYYRKQYETLQITTDTMNRLTLLSILCAAIAAAGCTTDAVSEHVAYADSQLRILVDECEPSDTVTLLPRALSNEGELKYTTPKGWTSGFFPGSLWYMYELTGDQYWADKAMRHTEILEDVQYNTAHHDTGFMIGCSYGNGLRLIGKEEYKPIIVQAAKSLCTLYRPAAGTIQSWSPENTTVKKNGWQCAVIIDNMMNLELLFEASKISGDPAFAEIAVTHANTTLKNHYREDYSCYHVVDYNPETGEINEKRTAQGFSDESVWSRGQGWSVYGYTLCYRYTQDPKYLAQAENIANFLLNHPNLPEDLVPYWDFLCPDIPNTPRDASSAAIIASALYELSTYSANGAFYKEKADKMIESLSAAPYRPELGSSHGFLLLSSVTSIPHGVDIDVPLNYADYYYLEALVRKRNIEKNN